MRFGLVELVVFVMFFGWLGVAVSAVKQYGDVVADVVSVYDGDTFKANISGWPDVVGDRISVRVAGIDTPEMRGKCDYERQLARKARQEAFNLLMGAKVVRLANIQRGKYFRLVADVYVDGVSLGDALIKQGLAVRYGGGTRVGWC